MLSFATEFPVQRAGEISTFVEAAREWISKSPHSSFDNAALKAIPLTGEWSISDEQEIIRTIGFNADTEQGCSIKRTSIDGDIEWTTEVTYSTRSSGTWVGVRTARESNHPAYTLPTAKKPIIVSLLLGILGGGVDGALTVQGHAHALSNDDIDLATDLILGDGGCHLPVVYLSCGFKGEYMLDGNALASDLAGMAHVVIEPNRAFSNRLQINVKSENVYGGVVGIYWPEGASKRSFFLPRDFSNATQMKRSIIDEVRNALLNRRPWQESTWLFVQERLSQQTYAALKASGTGQVEEYTAAFDSEIKAKDERIAEAEREIARLNREVRSNRVRAVPGSGIGFSTGTERDFYQNEIADIVYDALSDSLGRVASPSRRNDVISSILRENKKQGISETLRNEVKEALRQYKSMDKHTRATLLGLGFSINEDGKHFKLIYQEDPRYSFAIPKTGSDWRGGLNAASQIGKGVF